MEWCRKGWKRKEEKNNEWEWGDERMMMNETFQQDRVKTKRATAPQLYSKSTITWINWRWMDWSEAGRCLNGVEERNSGRTVEEEWWTERGYTGEDKSLCPIVLWFDWFVCVCVFGDTIIPYTAAACTDPQSISICQTSAAGNEFFMLLQNSISKLGFIMGECVFSPAQTNTLLSISQLHACGYSTWACWQMSEVSVKAGGPAHRINCYRVKFYSLLSFQCLSSRDWHYSNAISMLFDLSLQRDDKLRLWNELKIHFSLFLSYSFS